jgi:hypothetical protein
MTPELQEYYEALFDLFLQPGWKFLMEDFTADQKRIENIRQCVDEKSLYYNQGKLLTLDRIVEFEKNARQAYDDLMQEDYDADAS